MELTFVAAGAATVLAGLAVEQRFFARSGAARRGEAIAWSIGWLALALLIAAGIAIAGGPVGAWTTVYLIERSLSLDNVFLFSLLLVYFAVPPELRGRVNRHRRCAPAAWAGDRLGPRPRRGSRGSGLRVRRPAPLCRLPCSARRDRAD